MKDIIITKVEEKKFLGFTFKRNVKKTKLKIFEGAEDITQSRFNQAVIYSHILAHDYQTMHFFDLKEKVLELSKKGLHEQVQMVMDDYEALTKFKEKQIDPYNQIFSLITMEESEGLSCPTESERKEKIKRLEEAGLTNEIVVYNVDFFFLKFQTIFGTLNFHLESMIMPVMN